ncbi:MAG: M14 family zinc carboxypeptidase [Planctomycetota bacterium]
MKRRLLAPLAACCTVWLAGCAAEKIDGRAPGMDAPPPPRTPIFASEGGAAPEIAGLLLLGRSALGRPLELRTHGRGPIRVLLIGLIHGDEAEAFDRFDDLWAALVAAGMDHVITLHAIPSMNPDGYEQRRRSNARGVDLNRNWPAGNFRPGRTRGPAPLSEPETAAVHEHLLAFDPDAIIVLHSMRGGPLVDPDGPADDLAHAFVAAARTVDPRWRVQADFTNPPGSLGSYAGLDRGIATLTVEFRRGTDPQAAFEVARAGLAGTLGVLARRMR